MASRIEGVMFDTSKQEQIAERLKNLEKKEGPKSMRQIVADLLPAIQEKLEEGFSIKDIYNGILDDEDREKIALQTFTSYYYKAKKKADDLKEDTKRKNARLTKKQASENPAEETGDNKVKPAKAEKITDKTEKTMDKAASGQDKNYHPGEFAPDLNDDV